MAWALNAFILGIPARLSSCRTLHVVRTSRVLAQYPSSTAKITPLLHRTSNTQAETGTWKVILLMKQLILFYLYRQETERLTDHLSSSFSFTAWRRETRFIPGFVWHGAGDWVFRTGGPSFCFSSSAQGCRLLELAPKSASSWKNSGGGKKKERRNLF